MTHLLRMLVLLMVLTTFFTGCGGVTPRALLEPEGVHIIRGWTYATSDGEALQLDLYVPENYRRAVPIVLWLHGGGWMFGSHDGPLPIAALVKSSVTRASGKPQWCFDSRRSW